MIEPMDYVDANLIDANVAPLCLAFKTYYTQGHFLSQPILTIYWDNGCHNRYAIELQGIDKLNSLSYPTVLVIILPQDLGVRDNEI